MISCATDLAKGLINLIYPLTCETCGVKINTDVETGPLCQNCSSRITLINPAIPVKYNGIDVWAVCSYEGVLKECVHLFKYNARLSLLKPLSELMLNFTNIYLKTSEFDIIVPVPLHRGRLRERGFNQSELLAKKLADFTGLALAAKALKRIKPTQAQAGLSRTKRFANLKGAFKSGADAAVRGKNVLIVDDVFTTGNTLGECAKVLLDSGAESVSALVLARGI